MNALALGAPDFDDSEMENGAYLCMCCECGMPFTGHKHRVICQACQIDDTDESEST